MSSWMAIYEERPRQRIFFLPMSVQNGLRYSAWSYAVAEDKKTAESLLREKLRKIATIYEWQAELYRSAANLVADTEAGQDAT